MKIILVSNCCKCPYVHLRRFGRSVKCWHKSFSKLWGGRVIASVNKPEEPPQVVAIPDWCPLWDTDKLELTYDI